MTTSEKQFLEALGRVDTGKIKEVLDQENIDKAVADLMDFQQDMTDWEYDFINDIVVRLGQRTPLSEKQVEAIRKMEGKYL